MCARFYVCLLCSMNVCYKKKCIRKKKGIKENMQSVIFIIVDFLEVSLSLKFPFKSQNMISTRQLKKTLCIVSLFFWIVLLLLLAIKLVINVVFIFFTYFQVPDIVVLKKKSQRMPLLKIKDHEQPFLQNSLLD